MTTPTPPPGRQPPGWQPPGPYVSPPGSLGRAGGATPPVNPDETVQLRIPPGGQPGWPGLPAHVPPPVPTQNRAVPTVAPAEPVPAGPPRPWWAFLPTLIWLAAAAFTVGALIALS